MASDQEGMESESDESESDENDKRPSHKLSSKKYEESKCKTMRIKPRFCECIPPINSKYVGFYLTFDEIYGPIRHLGVEQYRQL